MSKKKSMYEYQIVCPFYHWESAKERKLCCEGGHGSVSHSVVYDTAAQMDSHRKRFCCSQEYKKCPIAQMCMEKYAEEMELEQTTDEEQAIAAEAAAIKLLRDVASGKVWYHTAEVPVRNACEIAAKLLVAKNREIMILRAAGREVEMFRPSKRE